MVNIFHHLFRPFYHKTPQADPDPPQADLTWVCVPYMLGSSLVLSP